MDRERSAKPDGVGSAGFRGLALIADVVVSLVTAARRAR